MDSLLGDMTTALEQFERLSTNHVVVIQEPLSLLEPGTHFIADPGSFHAYRIDGPDPGKPRDVFKRHYIFKELD